MRMAYKAGILAGSVLTIGVILGVRSTPPTRPMAYEQPISPTELKRPEAPPLPPEPRPPRPPIVDASPPPTALTANKKAVPTKPKLLNESELMARLRKVQDTDDYIQSYNLAREGLRRFPNSTDAPEMAAMVVKSLARQGKASEARAEAEVMVNKYTGTPWAREVERRTGAHPIQNQVPPK